MCQACDEMMLYYAYLDSVEEEKRKAQPWQCEVTVFPQDGARDGADAPAAAPPSAAKSIGQKPGFACDEPE